MSEFASALMVRLLSEGMRQSGMVLPAGLDLAQAAAPARAPLALKRALIGAVVAQRGRAALLELGMGIHRLAGTPVYQALHGARDPHDFIARWQRLERYMHSSHRIAVHASAPTQLVLQHHRPGQGPGPSIEESLLVLGVVIAGMQACGAAALRVQIGDVEVFPGAALGDTWPAAHWTLSWTLSPHMSGPGAMQEILDGLQWPALALRIARHLLADLAGCHSVGTIAESLGMSARSLQRELQRAGLSLTAVSAEIRSRAAAWWLCHTPHPVAQIGFACGFADQAHFTRAFSKLAGVPPAQYRLSLQSSVRPKL